MPVWAQNLVVLLAVAACLAAVIYQATRTLSGKRSRLGSCCAKGCPTETSSAKAQSSRPQRTVFLPIEFVGKGRK